MHSEASNSASSRAAQISLRPERPADESFLFEVYASTREEELAMTHWDTPTRHAFLTMQFQVMRKSYREMFPQAAFTIILRDGQPIGREVINRAPDEIRVVDVVLLPQWCGQGIGTILMQDVIAEAAAAHLPVRLHVLINSRAIRFYERLGFAKFGQSDIYQEMEWQPGG
jgi:ribosomal protein S18 acetylase RimI-like enzyme